MLRRTLAIAGAALLLAAASCGGSAAGSSDGNGQAGPVLGSSELVGAPRRVGATGQRAVPGLDRDAGVSARLRDGSVVWFFGDTGVRNPDGTMKFFTIGSAAWAPARTPTQPVDYVTGGQTVPFLTSQDGFPPCPEGFPNAGVWPLAAVTVPDGAEDRVLLFMGNTCLANGPAATSRGTSVAEWRYRPGTDPAAGPLQVTVLNPSLFVDGRYGSAAALGNDGWIYTYGCGIVPLPDEPVRETPCQAARVRPEQVADPAAYEPWDGSAWRTGANPAVLEMAPLADGPSNPPGPFSVNYDRSRNQWLMAYSPWPGYVPFGVVRAADAPHGPWGPPTEFRLPDCTDGLRDATRACYGVNLQPWNSLGDGVGIGWYDRFVTEPSSPGTTRRGAFFTSRLQLQD